MAKRDRFAWRPQKHFRAWFFAGLVATLVVDAIIFPQHFPSWLNAVLLLPCFWVTMSALQTWRLHAKGHLWHANRTLASLQRKRRVFAGNGRFNVSRLLLSDDWDVIVGGDPFAFANV